MVVVDEAGEKKVNGGDDLKSTQTYPLVFGWGNATMCSHHRAEVEKQFAASENYIAPEITMEELVWDTDRWDDADLDLVLACLQRCVIQRWG